MKALVAYATRNGSTIQVAETIAEELRAAGIDSDVVLIQEIKALSQYQALIIGGPGCIRQA
jgi:menaquinone-dependent protoporphyrinogen oxidase